MTHLALLALLLAKAPDAADRVLVFVRPGPPVKVLPDAERKAREKELRARYEDQLKAYRQLENDLKKQFGKTFEKWPEEQKRAFRAAGEAAGATEAERVFLDPDDKTADTVADFHKILADRKRLRLAANPQEAQLVIEVLARKATRMPGRSRVLYRVLLGDKVTLAQRQALDWSSAWWPARYLDAEEVQVVHSYTAKEPWWTVHESVGGFWSHAAGGAVLDLESLLAKNEKALASAH